MKAPKSYIFISLFLLSLLFSCSTLEKASRHGLTSGYYTYTSGKERARDVYLDVTEESMDVYSQSHGQPDMSPFRILKLNATDSLYEERMVFHKRSLDVDLTSILFKYRPPAYGIPAQVTSDFNFALYAGWRYDSYTVKTRKDPLGKSSYKVHDLGFDIGIFAGPGITQISPYTTQNIVPDEYSGLVIQAGLAAFIESSFASFGCAAGYDYLLNKDHNVWIYHKKPWVGFIVGIALN